MKDNQQNCALVVDDDDFLEGILTYGDIKRYFFKKYGDALKGDSLSVCIHYPCIFCSLLFAHFVNTSCLQEKPPIKYKII